MRQKIQLPFSAYLTEIKAFRKNCSINYPYRQPQIYQHDEVSIAVRIAPDPQRCFRSRQDPTLVLNTLVLIIL